MRRKLLCLRDDNKVYLYKKGDLCTEITGGWETPDGFNYNSYVKPLFYNDYVQIYAEPVYQSCTFQTKNKIDFSQYSTINFEIGVTMPSFRNAGSDWSYSVVGIYNNKFTGEATAGTIKELSAPNVVTERIVLTMDISNINTSAIVAAWATNSYSHSRVEFNIYNIWLER